MKNTTLFYLLPLLAACSKGGPAAGIPKLEGAWRQCSERANGQDLWLPYYYEPCRLDDQWIFAADGRYVIADSGLTCATSNPVRSGSWRLEGSTLLIDSISYEIVATDNQTLQLSRDRLMNGFAVRYELGLVRP